MGNDDYPFIILSLKLSQAGWKFWFSCKVNCRIHFINWNSIAELT